MLESDHVEPVHQELSLFEGNGVRARLEIRGVSREEAAETRSLLVPYVEIICNMEGSLDINSHDCVLAGIGVDDGEKGNVLGVSFVILFECVILVLESLFILNVDQIEEIVEIGLPLSWHLSAARDGSADSRQVFESDTLELSK